MVFWGIFGWVRRQVRRVYRFISSRISRVFRYIRSVISSIWKGIRSTAAKIYKFVRSGLANVWKALKALWPKFLEVLKARILQTHNWVNTMFDLFDKATNGKLTKLDKMLRDWVMDRFLDFAKKIFIHLLENLDKEIETLEEAETIGKTS